MKCPFCNNEMTQGWVQSSRRVLFTTIKNESFFDIKDESDVVLTANNFFYPTCAAYHCSTCKKVIIDYVKKTE